MNDYVRASQRNIERVFNVINRQLFFINEEPMNYDRIAEAFILLADLVAEFEGNSESLWSIGEFGCCTLDELIIDAYWHYSAWHRGQWSLGYSALSALGRVFTPGIGQEPMGATGDMLDAMAREAAA